MSLIIFRVQAMSRKRRDLLYEYQFLIYLMQIKESFELSEFSWNEYSNIVFHAVPLKIDDVKKKREFKIQTHEKCHWIFLTFGKIELIFMGKKLKLNKFCIKFNYFLPSWWDRKKVLFFIKMHQPGAKNWQLN